MRPVVAIVVCHWPRSSFERVVDPMARSPEVEGNAKGCKYPIFSTV
jgi:hypothetical protein